MWVACVRTSYDIKGGIGHGISQQSKEPAETRPISSCRATLHCRICGRPYLSDRTTASVGDGPRRAYIHADEPCLRCGGGGVECRTPTCRTPGADPGSEERGFGFG